MVWHKFLQRKLTNAVRVAKSLPKIHEIQLMAHGMQKPSNLRCVAFEKRLELLSIYSADHPTCTQVVFLQFHEKGDWDFLSIHCKDGMHLGKPIATMKVKNDGLLLIQDIFCKLCLQITI